MAHRLYDISRDSTAGGAGTQRWANPATWGGDGDDLPAVQLYNLLRGISYNGQWLYGLQSLPAARIPPDIIAQIEKCRATITGPDGPEPTYRTGGEIFVGAEVADTIETLLSGCHGRLSESGGSYNLHLGAPGASVASIDDSHILSTEEQSFTPFFGLAETITGINARFPSPEEGWTVKVAPPLIDLSLEAAAGNRRLMADVALEYVPYKGQVQRLMKSALEEAQRARRHTITLPPAYWGLEPGDYITWTSARNGYIAKLFRVDGVYDRANLDIVVDLTEVDPADYDWNQSIDYRVPVDGTVGVKRPPAQVISGFGVEASSLTNDAGIPVRPAIRLYWGWDEDEADIDGVQFEVRRAATGALQFEGTGNRPEAGELVIAAFSFTPDTNYEVRARFVATSKSRPMAWSVPMPVTTPDIRLGLDDIIPEQLVSEVLVSLAQMKAFVEIAALQELQEQMLGIAMIGAEEDASTVGDIRKLQLQVDAGTKGKADLSLVQAMGGQITILENGIEIVGAAVSQVQGALTGYDGPDAIANAFFGQSIQITNLAGDVTSLASSLLLTEAAVGKMSAAGYFRAEAIATMSGAQSTVAIGASATTGGPITTAAIVLNALAGGIGEVGVIANRFFVATDASGAGKSGLFVIDSGTVYIDNARIRGLTATHINVASLLASSAFINNLVVKNAQIENLTIGPDKVQVGAFRKLATGNHTGTPAMSYTTYATVAVQNPSGGPVNLVWFNSVTTSSATDRVNFRIMRGGTVVVQGTLFPPTGQTESVYIPWIDNPGAGNFTYSIQAHRVIGNTVTWTTEARFDYSLR